MCKSIVLHRLITIDLCYNIKMKHKIFLTFIVLIFTFGTVALADYVEPASTAPGSNTGAPLMTGPNATRTTFEKIGTWEFAKNPPDSTGLAEYDKSADLLKDSTYAGDETHKKGLFSEKLTVLGVSKIISGDLITKVDNTSGSSFDQFINSTTFVYPEKTSAQSAKSLEGVITGRMLGKIALTDKEDSFDPLNRSFNPAYTLDMLATNTSNFAPTTNIGLGDSCNLHPADIGASIGDGGGCPAGSYITYYKAPTFSGTLSSTNNTNTQTIATCTQFNPSIAPKNTGKCNTGRSFTDLKYVDKEPYSGNICTIIASAGSAWPSGYRRAGFSGRNVKLKWYDSGTYISSLDDKVDFTYGCGAGPWRVVANDDYGQYAEASE